MQNSDSEHPKNDIDDPSQLEDAITYLVSDLSSPLPEECLTTSPVPNEQYVKAAMISQHLPPAVTQARKLGIETIDHYLMVQGKGNQNQKQESRTNNIKHESEESQENSGSSGKTITLHEVTKQTHNVYSNLQDEQSLPQTNSIITTKETAVEPCITTQRDLRASHLQVSQNLNILSPTAAVKDMVNVSNSHNLCNIKAERNIDAYTHQQQPMMDPLEKSVNNNVIPDSKNLPLKRIYSDEDIKTSCSKKRHSNNNVAYASSDTNDDQQNVSYIDCKPFIGEVFSEPSSDFNLYNNMNPQSMKLAESPNSSLNDVVADYQQMDTSIPFIPQTLDDKFIDFPDLKDDPLLSPSLDANPGIELSKVTLHTSTKKVNKQILYIAK